MSLLDWQVVLLLVVPILPLAASIVLIRHWRQDSVSLHERALIAIRDLLVASVAFVLALSRLHVIAIPGEVALLLLSSALLLVSLPSAWWLYLYFRGRFD